MESLEILMEKINSLSNEFKSVICIFPGGEVSGAELENAFIDITEFRTLGFLREITDFLKEMYRNPPSPEVKDRAREKLIVYHKEHRYVTGVDKMLEDDTIQTGINLASVGALLTLGLSIFNQDFREYFSKIPPAMKGFYVVALPLLFATAGALCGHAVNKVRESRIYKSRRYKKSLENFFKEIESTQK